MKTLAIAIAFFSLVPVLRAQQAETAESSSQASQTAPQSAVQVPGAQNQLPAEVRPGHSLDPADVDVLTGKRDREMEASRRAAVAVKVGAYGEYGTYGDYFWMNGRLGDTWDMPMLPLARMSSPLFFGLGRRGGAGFSRGGFRGGR